MLTPTVLLVDAHDDSRAIYAAALTHFGFRVMQSACTLEAVRMAQRTVPSLVVLEVAIPAARAWSLIDALRQHPGTAAVPVLALSTTGEPEHQARARELGCAACLVKPLPPLELLAAARLVLGTG